MLCTNKVLNSTHGTLNYFKLKTISTNRLAILPLAHARGVKRSRLPGMEKRQSVCADSYAGKQNELSRQRQGNHGQQQRTGGELKDKQVNCIKHDVAMYCGK